MSLPALDAMPASMLEERVSALAHPGALDEPPTLKGLRVLVVDDDRDTRDLFTRALEQYDARVTAVASVKARAALARWKPDVLISDIAMPEESGYVLMQTIRGLTPEQGGAIPALALTAYAGPDDAQLALSAGFQAHLAKPIQPVRLALAVDELARGTRCDQR